MTAWLNTVLYLILLINELVLFTDHKNYNCHKIKVINYMKPIFTLFRFKTIFKFTFKINFIYLFPNCI